MEGNNNIIIKGRNYDCSNNLCSQDGTTKSHSGKIKSRARLNYYKSKRGFNIVASPLNLLHPSPPDVNTSNVNNNGPNNLKNGLIISGIVIGTSILLVIIIYFLFRFIRKRNSSELQEDEEEALPNPRDLTLNFVKHNHAIPELCTTPDTQPILDYYSSKAGLTNVSSSVINPNDSNNQIHKSTPVEDEESSEENINNEYVPQYYNGIEIPPLGARIIPLERQIQIAKELTSSNLNPSNNKRKSNRSISSILSISSRRKSSTSNATINNFHNNNNNNNSSTTLTLIRETSRDENAANIVP